MGGDPHLSCYVPLGGVGLALLLAAAWLALPIALEFLGGITSVIGLAARVGGRRPARVAVRADVVGFEPAGGTDGGIARLPLPSPAGDGEDELDRAA